MKTGIELITEERKEQIEKHQRTVEFDIALNYDYQLQEAAIWLISGRNNQRPPNGWDEKIWNYMLSKSLKERLIIAGALIAAEIDRLQTK